jgi:hypothetical protein
MGFSPHQLKTMFGKGHAKRLDAQLLFLLDLAGLVRGLLN